MWLRDYLKDDMPKCRVLTFGYNTKLTINNNYRFEDFCKELLSQLSIARSSDTVIMRLHHIYRQGTDSLGFVSAAGTRRPQLWNQGHRSGK